MDRIFLKKQLERFYLEDIGYKDITTDSLTVDKQIKAKIIAKEDGIFAGGIFAKEVFLMVDNTLEINILKKEGQEIKKGETLIEIKGSGKSILKGERLSLNILQRLSGIATKTREFVKALEGTKTKLLDTRKTTPGFRAFEKYAVKIGGGYNHRFALYDMVMIKDNHISLVGSIKEAVNQIKRNVSPMVKIEVETSNLEQVKEALESDVDIIMLDNMSLKEMKDAVKLINGKALTEASGNITLENIKQVAQTGVDFISTGATIHSSKWLDISLKF
ncbi:carboxylating nicotinate-nucleotide diphosphorylase [Hydrogenothermus marinus]|uniref:Probable nicotinate-nucleotide pyrophosphorylase [carboxylating] n=1 Tax=Hydrogenothermus marinus TaxID=133270 RepID=A0A3M0BHV2_9AQUI|nr:carboxylating nicotinate-nucleotide diphosphorylase [Hydrogenothermus marinus]RMA96166.1 nicotinate-nucleotide pyrophosphorylase [carboxylating] [Hydrogenothermus marinus]